MDEKPPEMLLYTVSWLRLGGNKENGKIQLIFPHLQTEEFPKHKTGKENVKAFSALRVRWVFRLWFNSKNVHNSTSANSPSMTLLTQPTSTQSCLPVTVLSAPQLPHRASIILIFSLKYLLHTLPPSHLLKSRNWWKR